MAPIKKVPTRVIVALVSQKGGVGKSTLARALGAVAARADLYVTIVDLDPQQKTVVEWQKMRLDSKIARQIVVEAFDTIEETLDFAQDGDLLIVDTPARANRSTLDVAREAHLIVQPSSGSLDDLRPAVLLFHELKHAGIPQDRLVVALSRILTKNEEITARTYVESAGYAVLPGAIREQAAYRDAQNRGKALNETQDKNLNAQADALVTALLELAVAEAKEERKPDPSRKRDTGGAA